MRFCTFSTFAQKIFKGWDWNFTWSFGKVMRSKEVKMVFISRIIRHRLYMIYAFFDFFCSKIIFDKKLSSFCEDKFDYLGSIVYLSCFVLHLYTKKRKKSIYFRRLFSWKGTQLMISIMRFCPEFKISTLCADPSPPFKALIC